MAGAREVKAIETLQPTFDEMQDSIIKEVNRLITDNQLTQELALQKWYELNALHTVPKKVLRGANRSRG